VAVVSDEVGPTIKPVEDEEHAMTALKAVTQTLTFGFDILVYLGPPITLWARARQGKRQIFHIAGGIAAGPVAPISPSCATAARPLYLPKLVPNDARSQEGLFPQSNDLWYP
jgi:hypothetical protein